MAETRDQVSGRWALNSSVAGGPAISRSIFPPEHYRSRSGRSQPSDQATAGNRPPVTTGTGVESRGTDRHLIGATTLDPGCGENRSALRDFDDLPVVPVTQPFEDGTAARQVIN